MLLRWRLVLVDASTTTFAGGFFVDFATLTRIAPEYVNNTIALHGEDGRRWLNGLGEKIAARERRWNLRVGPPFPDLSYNYVAPAQLGSGSPVVLKLCVPNHQLGTELDALRHYDGRGCARLLASDEAAGAILLERLMSGTLLSDLDDDEEATAIAAAVMRQLWKPAPAGHRFPTVADWGQGFQALRARFDGTGPLPAALVERAETHFAELTASAAPAVVLHGDLHHGNILAAEREPWLAIDPHGVVGEPAFEGSALLRNPTPGIARWPNLEQVMRRRVDQLAEALGFERERIRDWGVAQAVLSAWWYIEDGAGSWEPNIRVAETLAAVRW